MQEIQSGLQVFAKNPTGHAFEYNVTIDVNELHLIVVFSGCLVKRSRHKTPMSPTDLRLFAVVYYDSFYFISTSLCVPENEIKSKYAMFGNLISCGLTI